MARSGSIMWAHNPWVTFVCEELKLSLQRGAICYHGLEVLLVKQPGKQELHHIPSTQCYRRTQSLPDALSDANGCQDRHEHEYRRARIGPGRFLTVGGFIPLGISPHFVHGLVHGEMQPSAGMDVIQYWTTANQEHVSFLRYFSLWPLSVGVE